MKHLDVGKEIKDYRGDPIPGSDGNIKIKDILNQYVAGYQGKDGNKIILAWKIGQKIYDAEGEIALEDAEFELIQECVNATPRHSAVLLGPVFHELKEAEKRAEEKNQ